MKEHFDIIRLTETQINWLSDFGNAFDMTRDTELLEHPSLPKVMLDVTVPGKGRTICRVEILPPSKIPKEALAGRKPTSKNALFLSVYQIIRDRKVPIFASFQWDTADGIVGAICPFDSVRGFVSQEVLMEQESLYTNTFLAIQHFMLEEHNLLETKYVHDKTYSSDEIPLTAPFSKPGYVKIHCFGKVYEGRVKEIVSKRTKWHCPAWGVRGHYRHYKNGNVVFIQPYIKGKEKDRYEGREYKLF